MISVVALTEWLGRQVGDAEGGVVGRLQDLAVVPLDHPTRVAYLVVRVGREDRVISAETLTSIIGGTLRLRSQPGDAPAMPTENLLLLKRDLLDQQIIDVLGRKLVRVNDVELDARPQGDELILTVLGVDVGARGAVRRLAKGLVPRHSLRNLLSRIPARVIPWHFVDLLESDPARRVKLKIAYQGLSTLHPADIADIVEDLAPAEREAVFETLDEEVAAGTLEELDRWTQLAVVEALDSDRAADIVEEMRPDAAADLLGDLPADQSGAILQEMEPEERQQVRTLLSFGERTAAGRMTTEYLAMPADASVDAMIETLRRFTGGMEALATIYLTDSAGDLVGAVPLAKAVVAGGQTTLRTLSDDPVVSCPADTPDEQVAELFDKYNLLTLPVVDEHGRLAGIITADDVINVLRAAD
jgi:CBS domain-containing protein/sporulation protein YlmC with PRC-barrel domain